MSEHHVRLRIEGLAAVEGRLREMLAALPELAATTRLKEEADKLAAEIERLKAAGA